MPSNNQKYEIGIVGLGVMGRNLLLNFSDHGFSCIGYDKDEDKRASLKLEAEKNPRPGHEIFAAESLMQFASLLRKPRAVLIMVPAGDAVDEVIAGLSPMMEKGDILIDGGNSYYKDTNLRGENLSKHGIHFYGIGISGGEEGARNGPSIMPGGPLEAYGRIGPMLEAAAAKVKGEPCVAYLGLGSAGHFVKMVHNGIEYGLMQIISETYDFMKNCLKLDEQAIGGIYARWNEGELNGYLMEITSKIFQRKDQKTGKYLIDEILDVAKQKGTGMWTSQSAMELQVPAFTIDIAVGMRFMSMLQEERREANAIFGDCIKAYGGDQQLVLTKVRQSLYAAMIVVYAQGMAILQAASNNYNYRLDSTTVARIWRGGCIIRSALLDHIRNAFHEKPRLPNLLLDPSIAKMITGNEEALRSFVALSTELGLPCPGLMTALSYLDTYRRCMLPANLIQAQRDFFGAHTYERIDAKGTFHTNWE